MAAVAWVSGELLEVWDDMGADERLEEYGVSTTIDY
jgi:hypothetical protein